MEYLIGALGIGATIAMGIVVFFFRRNNRLDHKNWRKVGDHAFN